VLRSPAPLRTIRACSSQLRAAFCDAPLRVGGCKPPDLTGLSRRTKMSQWWWVRRGPVFGIGILDDSGFLLRASVIAAILDPPSTAIRGPRSWRAASTDRHAPSGPGRTVDPDPCVGWNAAVARELGRLGNRAHRHTSQAASLAATTRCALVRTDMIACAARSRNARSQCSTTAAGPSFGFMCRWIACEPPQRAAAHRACRIEAGAPEHGYASHAGRAYGADTRMSPLCSLQAYGRRAHRRSGRTLPLTAAGCPRWRGRCERRTSHLPTRWQPWAVRLDSTVASGVPFSEGLVSSE
jgi:hypothetical protein